MTDKPRDELTKTTDEGKIELKEEELNRAAAAGGQPDVFLKIKLTQVLVTSYQTGSK